MPLECRNVQDAEEKFPMQQHFFPSLPFLTPFIYNSPVANLCCSHSGTAATNDQQKHTTSENEKMRNFTQKEKCSFRGTLEEDTQKNNFSLGHGIPFLAPPFYFSNPQDPQFNPYYQLCGCGDSFPWSCGSFIVPVISYCVFWNSRLHNMNMLAGMQETMCKHNKQNNKNSEGGREDLPKNVVKDVKSDTTDDSCGALGGNAGKKEWINRELLAEHAAQNTLKPFLSVTCISSSFIREETTENEKIQETGSDGGCTEGDDEEDEEDEEEESAGSWHCDEAKKNMVEKHGPSVERDTQNYQKDVESQPSSAAESSSDLKKAENTGASVPETSCSETEVEHSDISTEEKYDLKNVVRAKGMNYRQRISIKKFINNFTMTDQTSRSCVEKLVEKALAAAAGDLGGINCVGYKVDILDCHVDEQFKILEETPIQNNFQAKNSFPEALVDGKQDADAQKNSEKSSKTGKNFKSGIAKLSMNSKFKETKGDAEKNKKNEKKEHCPREPIKKHNCFPSECTLMGINDNSSKAQKTKSTRAVHIQNAEKQQKNDKLEKRNSQKGRKSSKG